MKCDQWVFMLGMLDKAVRGLCRAAVNHHREHFFMKRGSKVTEKITQRKLARCQRLFKD